MGDRVTASPSRDVLAPSRRRTHAPAAKEFEKILGSVLTSREELQDWIVQIDERKQGLPFALRIDEDAVLVRDPRSLRVRNDWLQEVLDRVLSTQICNIVASEPIRQMLEQNGGIGRSVPVERIPLNIGVM